MTTDQIVHSLSDTWRLAADVTALLPRGGVIALSGDLGAGKTAFVQGVARALGIARPVTSPTFTLVGDYAGPGGRLVHMDLYRMTGPDDLLTIGFPDYLESGAIVAVEWPERAGDLIPPDAVQVALTLLPDRASRRIVIRTPPATARIRHEP
jgi:tRNA threonylcarbamoyladenosine biosynthesis protein TsaE